jgi:hypothetical protein
MLRIHPGRGFNATSSEYIEILVDEALDWEHVNRFLSLSLNSDIQLTTGSDITVPKSGSVFEYLERLKESAVLYYHRPSGIDVGTQTTCMKKKQRGRIKFPPFGVSSAKYLAIRRLHQ